MDWLAIDHQAYTNAGPYRHIGQGFSHLMFAMFELGPSTGIDICIYGKVLSLYTIFDVFKKGIEAPFLFWRVLNHTVVVRRFIEFQGAKGGDANFFNGFILEKILYALH